MRAVIYSLALTLLALPAIGFEIEETLDFPGAGDGPTLRIISTADTSVFSPIITAFQDANPSVGIEYVAVTSSEVMTALAEEGAEFDLAISSAMDLQVKLANDGLADAYFSDLTRALPDWARWHDQVFAFTLEPATMVLSRAAFQGLELPTTRQELITLLRDNPDMFRGRIGTYDVRESGSGYLFATQDARTSETYWRLSELMGGLQARLYSSSADMIGDVASGEIAVAYNVLGSYAGARDDLHDQIIIIPPADFTTVMLRTALIPNSANEVELAGQMIDHLIETSWLGSDTSFNFPGVTPDALAENAALRPIQLGPGLLVYLDRLKRRQFLAEWEAALVQPE